MANKFKQAMDLLHRGKLDEAKKILSKMEKQQPNNPDILYNLGMIHSEHGEYDLALDKLQRCTKIAPNHVNALVALGLANFRDGNLKQAECHYLEALRKDPENIYALQNLGGLYAKEKRLEDAISVFEKGERFAPEHPNFLYGIALAHYDLGNLKESEEYYRKILDRGVEDHFTELARTGLSQIAHSSFKTEAPRMDAVMYCLAALEKFSEMPIPDVHRVTFEIAMLGRNGLSVDDPSRKYKLDSMPGDFTGLQLVSYMYVGFQMIEPSMDIGFDLSSEYETAKALFSKKVENEKRTIL